MFGCVCAVTGASAEGVAWLLVLFSANTLPDWIASNIRVDAVISLGLSNFISSPLVYTGVTLAQFDIKRKQM